jgi:hypothetical protein
LYSKRQPNKGAGYVYKREKKNAGCADALPRARLANDTKKQQPFMFYMNGCCFFKEQQRSC